jgi:AcrR family transcriptional regulator
MIQIVREKPSKRPYHLGLRQKSIDRNRAQILRAARAVFSKAGFHGAGLEEVALRAGVSRKTVYYQFGSKMGLLEALVSELETSVAQPGRIQIIIQQSGRRAVLDYFAEVGKFWGRNHEIMRVLHGVAATDADARKVLDRHDLARRKRLTTFVERLARRDELRQNWTSSRAVDLLWLLSSFASFDQLVERSRISVETAARTLAEASLVLLKPTYHAEKRG